MVSTHRSTDPQVSQDLLAYGRIAKEGVHNMIPAGSEDGNPGVSSPARQAVTSLEETADPGPRHLAGGRVAKKGMQDMVPVCRKDGCPGIKQQDQG